MMKIEKCPYHDVEPEYWLRIFRHKMEKTWRDKDGTKHALVLPRLADHYYFCPECKKITSKDGGNKMNSQPEYANMSKLAVGYCSSKSASAALSNWNKAVINMTIKIFKKAVSGK